MSARGVTFRQRLELRLARVIPLLPPRLQVRLSGKPPVQREGQTLAPDLQLMLSAVERRGRPPYEEMSVERARYEMRAGSFAAGGTPDPSISPKVLEIEGAAGPLPAHLYEAPAIPRPAGASAEDATAQRASRPPLIVFLHGGGFVLGDLASHDVPCRILARHAGAHVLSVQYRLAPEHPFPAPVEDALAALRWAHEHAARLGADPDRIAIAGDSAGGNLSAVATWLAVTEGAAPAPVAQFLIYPATEFVELSRSQTHFDEGFLLVRRDMDWFADHYAGAHDRTDPRLSIARAGRLEGLPPTLVVTAGFDPLRDEGEAFARRLADVGVTVLARRFPDQIHGFINLVGVSRSSRDALLEIAGSMRAMLATTVGRVGGSADDGDLNTELSRLATPSREA